MAYALLILISMLWGTSFIFIKIALNAISPLGIAAGRVAIAAVFLLTIAAVRKSQWPGSAVLWAKLAALALLGQILPFVMLGIAGRLTTSVNMALMMGATPLAMFILSAFVPPRERWSGVTALGLLVGVIGVTISLSTPTASEPVIMDNDWAGRLFALAAAIGYAAGAVISKNISQNMEISMVASISMLISSIFLAPSWLCMQLFSIDYPALHISWEALASLLTLGVFNTALAYVVYFHLIHTEGAVFAGMNNYIVPPFGMALGAVILGEPFGIVSLLGCALITGGVVLVRQGKRPENTP